MKTIKGLLLGAAAALSTGSAFAADLSMPAAEPVEYVRVCDAYGAGYSFIPGTDTCLRVSGYVRVQAYYHTDNVNVTNYTGFATNIIAPAVTFGATAAAPTVFTFLSSQTVDQLDMGIRALLRFDARSRTEWGVLRSFFEFAADSATNAINGSNLVVRYGFVQIGPVTAGLTDSFFNFDNGSYYGDVVGDRTSRVVAFAYTASFGNGISATIALEDATVPQGAGQAGIGGTTGGLLLPTAGLTNRSSQLPDLVGNIRVAQAWGTAQLSAVVGQRRYIDTASIVNGVAGFTTSWSDTVWAIKGGLRINLDMLARGSNFQVQATYGEGASNFVFTGNANNYWQSTRLASGVLDDTVLSRIDAWSVFAQFQHFFTPAIRGTLYGGYADIDYGGRGFALAANTVVLDRTYQIGGQIQWTPVRNLDLGLDVFYTNARYNAIYNALPGTVNAGRVDSATDDAWGAIFRIQRSF